MKGIGFAIAAALLMAACAATPARPAGPAVTVVSHEAQVCIDSGHLQPGAQVQFVRRVCRQRTPKVTILDCTAESIGSAQVVRLVDERCAIVRLPLDSQLQPGDQIEIAAR